MDRQSQKLLVHNGWMVFVQVSGARKCFPQPHPQHRATVIHSDTPRPQQAVHTCVYKRANTVVPNSRRRVDAGDDAPLGSRATKPPAPKVARKGKASAPEESGASNFPPR